MLTEQFLPVHIQLRAKVTLPPKFPFVIDYIYFVCRALMFFGCSEQQICILHDTRTDLYYTVIKVHIKSSCHLSGQDVSCINGKCESSVVMFIMQLICIRISCMRFQMLHQKLSLCEFFFFKSTNTVMQYAHNWHNYMSVYWHLISCFPVVHSSSALP